MKHVFEAIGDNISVTVGAENRTEITAIKWYHLINVSQQILLLSECQEFSKKQVLELIYCIEKLSGR